MDDPNVLLDFFNREHYQTYYTKLAHALKSVDAAILYQEFVQRHQYHEKEKELIAIPGKGEGWFYHTKEYIFERTAINRYDQDKAIDILKKNKLIESVQYGMPCKRYLKLNINGLVEFSKNLSRKLTFDRQESLPSADKEVDVELTTPYTKEPKEEPKEEEEVLTSTHTNEKKGKKKKIEIPKTEFAENVLLYKKQYQTLLEKYGETKLKWMIDHLSMKKGAKGYVYESDYHVLLPANWVNEEYEKQKNVKKAPTIDAKSNKLPKDPGEKLFENRAVSERIRGIVQSLCNSKRNFEVEGHQSILFYSIPAGNLTKKFNYIHEPDIVFEKEIYTFVASVFPEVKEQLQKEYENRQKD